MSNEKDYLNLKDRDILIKTAVKVDNLKDNAEKAERNINQKIDGIQQKLDAHKRIVYVKLDEVKTFMDENKDLPDIKKIARNNHDSILSMNSVESGKESIKKSFGKKSDRIVAGLVLVVMILEVVHIVLQQAQSS